MKTTGIGFAFAFAISTCGAAYAVETFSLPTIIDRGGLVYCLAQNLGDQPVTVGATLIRSDGTTATSGHADVPAGGSVEIAVDDVHDFLAAYCVFDFDGDPATVRGYIHSRPEDGETQALMPSFEAPTAAAEAVVTYSPPLRSISDAFLGCIVQNLGDGPADVETALIDNDGSVISLSQDEIPPGAVRDVIATDADHLGAYCRFVFNGNAEQVRTFAALYFVESRPHLIFRARPAAAVDSVVKYTPPVSSPEGAATTCVVQNLDDNIISANVSLIDSDGTVLGSGFEFIQPGDVETVAGVTEATTNAICRIQFADESNLARGYISRFPSGMFANTDLLEEAAAPRGAALLDVITYSPPIRSTDSLFLCTLENLSEEDVEVLVEIADGTGAIIGMQDVVAEPGRGRTGIGTFQDLTAGVCRFTFDGSPDDIRGFVTLQDNPAGRTRLIFAAAPAGAPLPTSTPTMTMRPTFTHTHSPTATATSMNTATRTPTATPQPTSTPSPASTATDTSTPTQTPSLTHISTSTFTPEHTPTHTPPPCVGDCDGEGNVTVDEILRMVNIALGASIDDCRAGDANGDGDVTVDEILTAVTNALDGCP
jgi:hypothetical protein